MNLEELKTLLGIPIDDTDEDAILKIKLAGAIEITELWFLKYAKKKYINYDSSGRFIIPEGAKLAISKYVETSDITAGVRSESIGGMSQTFGGGSNTNTNNSPLDDFYAYLEIYKCDDEISFVPMRKYKK